MPQHTRRERCSHKSPFRILITVKRPEAWSALILTVDTTKVSQMRVWLITRTEMHRIPPASLSRKILVLRLNAFSSCKATWVRCQLMYSYVCILGGLSSPKKKGGKTKMRDEKEKKIKRKKKNSKKPPVLETQHLISTQILFSFAFIQCADNTF